MIRWAFLGLSLMSLALTLNAWRPARAPGIVAAVSFFAGWLTSELALHQIGGQIVLASSLAHFGAARSWVGKCALGVFALSWGALFALHRKSESVSRSVASSLNEALGVGYAATLTEGARGWLREAIPWRSIALPFWPRAATLERIRNVPHHTIGRTVLTLDVLRRRGSFAESERGPTLIFVHGGGWTIGPRAFQGLPLMEHLAARGWICFSIGYRLSPAATFPEHLIDVKRAIAWVREHAGDYGADPEFVVISGNSAGAHLASLAALTQNDPEYQPGFERRDTSVRGCIAFYGIYDFTNRFSHWPNRSLARLLERYVMKTTVAAAPEAYEKASPIARIHRDAPPFFVVHGDRDTLAPVEDARRFVAQLRSIAQAPVAYAEVHGAQHAFEIFPSLRTAYVLQGVERFVAWLYSRYIAERNSRVAKLAQRS